MTVYTGHYSKRFVPECEACHKGVEMEVTAEMVNGSPVTSTESQDAADTEEPVKTGRLSDTMSVELFIVKYSAPKK